MSSRAAPAAPAPKLPPSLLAAQLRQIKAQPFLYIVGSLFLPLGVTILLAWFVVHSAFLAAAADAISGWWKFLLYLLWHRRGTTHSMLASNVQLTDFYIPCILALITLKALIQHSLSKHLPHTSSKKRKAVLGVGMGYAAAIWIGFRGVAQTAGETVEQDLLKGNTGVTPSSLFLTLYHSTLLFSLVSLISPFWVPTSDEQLREAESNVLKAHLSKNNNAKAENGPSEMLPTHYAAHHSYILLESAHAQVDEGSNQPDENEGEQKGKNTNSRMTFDTVPPFPATQPAIVCLHGYGAGKAFWFANLPTISARLPGTRVYALDLLGMGCSAHQMNMDSCHTSADAEKWFVDALENWRKTVGAEKMVLVGHSFGGYISACYALRYPNRVAHLILASPVGLPVPPPFDPAAPSRAPYWAQRFGLIHLLRWLWSKHITLSQGLHFLGPLGPWIFCSIVKGRFAHLAQNGHEVDLQAIANYTYHLNAGACPGHKGLNLLLIPGAYAIDPLLPRLAKLQTGVSLLYGATDWMDAASGQALTETLNAAGEYHAECFIIEKAGHQLFLENPKSFNDAIVTIVKNAREREKKNTRASKPSAASTNDDLNGSTAPASKIMKRAAAGKVNGMKE